MNIWAMIGASALWLWFWHRVEGGWRPSSFLPKGTGKGRIMWAAACALLALAGIILGGHGLVLSAEVGGLVLVTAYVGSYLPHKPWQEIGAPLTYGGSNDPWFVVEGAILGALQLALLILPAAWLLHSWPLLFWGIAGAGQAAVYLIGRFLPWPFLTIGTNGMIDAPTAWGECLTGGLFGAVLCLAMLA